MCIYWFLIFFGTSFFACGISDSRTAITTQRKPPPDLTIAAEYWPGSAQYKSWKTTITPKGITNQEWYSFYGKSKKTGAKSYKLSQQDLMDLFVKVAESDFFKLRSKYDYIITDNPTLILKITMNGKVHEVMIYAPSHQRHKSAVQRFLIVWDEVLRKVPSPNESQLPGLYTK